MTYTLELTEEEASWLAHVMAQMSDREAVSDRKYAPAIWAKLDWSAPASCLRCGAAATTTEPVPLCARCIAEEASDVDLDAVDAYLRGSADEARL